MDHQQVEYKGYTILPTAIREGEDMYFGGYEISKDGKLVSGKTLCRDFSIAMRR